MSWDTLLGNVLPSGWTVVERRVSARGDTGSNFSVGFFVEKGGTRAFMKIFDLDKLISHHSGNIAKIGPLIELFNRECNLLESFKDSGAKRIVTPLERGTIKAPAVNTKIDFEYMIFELADVDLRRHYNYSRAVDMAFALSILRHTAEGLGEMHAKRVAHQDIKPSNILLFGDDSKLADLGCASSEGDSIWHDLWVFFGDWTYAAPEALYKQDYSKWHDRRQAKDLWALGSMIVFLVSKVVLTAQMISALPRDHHPDIWGDSYESLLPMLRNALQRVLRDQPSFDTEIGRELRSVVLELCDPDPMRRGSPKVFNRPQKFSMQRYFSIFDRLMRRVIILGAH